MKGKYIAVLIAAGIVVIGVICVIVNKRSKNGKKEQMGTESEAKRTVPDEASVEQTKREVMDNMQSRTEAAKEVVKESFEEMKKSVDSIEKQKSEIDDLMKDLKS